MRVTDILMRPGGWSMSLLPSTPPSILSAVRGSIATYDSTNERWTSVLDGQIVVFDTDLREPSLERARYTGALRATSGLSFSGPGVAAYLQTDEGLGDHVADVTQESEWNISEAASALSGLDLNGITLGTIETGGPLNYISTPPMGPREILDSACLLFGHEWRVNADGTLDIDEAADLFVTDPTVLVDDRPGGSFGAIRRINGTATSVLIDASGVTSQITAYVDNVAVPGTATAGVTVGRGLDGTVLVHERAVDAGGVEESEASGVAAAALASFQYPRASFTVTTNDPFIRRYVQPGDTVYVYAPQSGIKSGNALSIGGETVYPQKVRVHEMDWGVHDGHGVFLRRHNGTTESWLRLTPYVQFADATSTWRIGTSRGPFDAVGPQARLGDFDSENPDYVMPAFVFPNESQPLIAPKYRLNGPASASAPAVPLPPPYAPARRGV